MRLKAKAILMKSWKLLIVFLIIAACNETYTPRPRGYFRIDFPEKNYKRLDAKLPYSSHRWYIRSMKKANITFYLKDADKVELQILNESGEILKTFSLDADKGLNFFEWDLYTKGESEFTKAGNHQILIKGNGFEVKKEFKVEPFK